MRTQLILIILILLSDGFSLAFTGQEKSLSNIRKTKTFNKLDLGVAVDMHLIVLKNDDEPAEAPSEMNPYGSPAKNYLDLNDFATVSNTPIGISLYGIYGKFLKFQVEYMHIKYKLGNAYSLEDSNISSVWINQYKYRILFAVGYHTFIDYNMEVFPYITSGIAANSYEDEYHAKSGEVINVSNENVILKSKASFLFGVGMNYFVYKFITTNFEMGWDIMNLEFQDEEVNSTMSEFLGDGGYFYVKLGVSCFYRLRL